MAMRLLGAGTVTRKDAETQSLSRDLIFDNSFFILLVLNSPMFVESAQLIMAISS